MGFWSEVKGKIGFGERKAYSATDLKQKLKDPSALLVEIIGRLQALDRAAQIRIADELFGGTGGERFVELLSRGADGIRATIKEAHDLGAVMDDEVIARADELDRKFNKIGTTISTWTKQAVVGLVGAMDDFLDRWNKIEEQSNRNVQRGLTAVYEDLQEAKNVLADLQSQATHATNEDIDAALASIEELDLTGGKPIDGEIILPVKASKAKEKAPKIAKGKDFYGALSPADAKTLREAEIKIQRYSKGMSSCMIEIGKELAKAKQAMPGLFNQWTKEKLDYDTRTAQRYMKAADVFGNEPKVVEKLAGDIVYALASDSTPDAFRQQIVDEVNSGKVPRRADIEERLKAAKQAATPAQAPKAAANPKAVAQSAPVKTSTADATEAAEMLACDFTGNKGDLLGLLSDVDPVEFLEELKAAIKTLDA